jgi:repressor LexA
MLSVRKQLILDFVAAYTKKWGIPPSYEVIAKAMGLKAKSNVHRLVKSLEKDGYVQTRPGKFYSIKIVDRSVKDVTSL